jgi:integrase
MTRRAFGSIDQLQSGRWRARYRDTAGHAHSRLFKTKTDASAFLATIEADLLRGDWNDPRLTGVPLRVWAEQWFETTAHLKPKTRIEYEANLRNHVLPTFGDKPVGAIDALSVRQFVSALRGDGLEHGTVKKAKAVLSMVLGSAAEAGAIKANPCANIKIGRAARREMVFLTADEVEALADAIVEPYGTLVRFAAYTGLRAGEIAALRVGRLDMLRRRVEVAESLSIVPGQGLVFGPTKNYQRRTVPLPAFLADELAEHLASRGSPGREALVFTSQQGAPLRQHHFYWRHFKPAVQRARLDVQPRFHDLRHTCVALLIAEGAHHLTIMRRLGHSSIQVTLDTYGHLFPELEEDVTQRLDAVGRAARSRHAS